MKRKKCVALSLLIALVLYTICNSGVSNAETTTGIKETISCTVNGVERTLTWYENGSIDFQIGTSAPFQIHSDVFLLSMQFDANGTCWFYKNDRYDENENDYLLYWWNYDISPNDDMCLGIPKLNSDGTCTYVNDVESLIFDSSNNFIIGYKTFSGEAYEIPTFEDLKIFFLEDDYHKYPQPRPLKEIPTSTPTATITPTSVPTSEPTPTLSTPTETPVSPTTTPVATSTTVPTPTPTNTDKPIVTQKPTVSPQPTVSPKVSLKKQSGYTCLSVGNKVVSKYKLKKSVLTWKGTKKSIKVKQVKQVGYIEKSQNLIYMTKKGRAYTISQKGKKKTILKKGAKKLIFKNDYVTRIKKKSGYMNVANK